MILGIIVGFFAGLTNPLLMGSIKLVVDTVFTDAKSSGLLTKQRPVPGFFQPLLDWIQTWAAGFDARSSTTMTVLVIGTIPLAMLLRGLFGYLNTYLMNWVAIRAITDLRVRLFSHLLTLDASFFNRTSTGELMARFTELGYLHSLVSSSLVTVIREPITILSLLALLVVQQPKLSLVVLVVLPVSLIPFVVYSRKVRKSSGGMYQQFADLGKLMHETFTGYRVVKAYNLEERVVEEYDKTSRFGVSYFMRMLRSAELPGPLIEFIGAVGVAAFFLYLALYERGQTPGGLLQFVGSIFLMYAPIKNLLRLHNQLEQANSASQHLFVLLDTQSVIVEPAQPKALASAGQAVEFDHVTFGYNATPVLHDITLTVPAGKMIALVGGSGAGKTTLTNLLLRFYDPGAGAIRIGGVDIREVTTRTLRSQIAVVAQEVVLFNDTIRNNILLGRPGAADADVQAAARHAHAHEFILQQPNGYDTVIGERGAALSGGQRQRMAIARAILKNAPILILDEATSALDTKIERHVQAALEDLMEGRTTICIAHRLSTIQKADLIVVLEQGRIVETGTHAELLAHGRVYRKLFDLQFNA